MACRAVPALIGAALLALAGGCSATEGVPDRPPDVTGVVAGADEPGGPVLAEPSDGYYEGMGLLRGDPILVRDDGAAVAYSELEDGAPVEVWTEGPCAESFPVQCGIVALRVEQ